MGRDGCELCVAAMLASADDGEQTRRNLDGQRLGRVLARFVTPGAVTPHRFHWPGPSELCATLRLAQVDGAGGFLGQRAKRTRRQFERPEAPEVDGSGLGASAIIVARCSAHVSVHLFDLISSAHNSRALPT